MSTCFFLKLPLIFCCSSFPSNHTLAFLHVPLISSALFRNEHEYDMKVTSSTTGVSSCDENSSARCLFFFRPDGVVQADYGLLMNEKSLSWNFQCYLSPVVDVSCRTVRHSVGPRWTWWITCFLWYPNCMYCCFCELWNVVFCWFHLYFYFLAVCFLLFRMGSVKLCFIASMNEILKSSFKFVSSSKEAWSTRNVADKEIT